MNILIGLILGMMALASACDRPVPIDNISDIPEVQPADSAYANVYQKLDGTWRGTFYIYRDTAPADRRESLLQNLDPDLLDRLPFFLSDSLIVTQEYDSKTPFFQTVRISDYYPDRDETVVSRGVNKIQNGKMWCVVRKPDETVIHQGELDGTNTIIWSRSEEDPLKVEYFREKVAEDTYEIIGYGYYGDADESKMPPFWFYAKYYQV